MKVLVTGASGFIGSAVVDELRRRDVEIVAFARSVSRLRARDAFAQVLETDIASADAESYDRVGRPDVLIHLAWGGLPNYLSRNHYEVELPLHYRFLRMLIEAGLPAAIVAGTCFEYGLANGALEEDTLSNPVTPYGFAKDALRRQVQFLTREYDFALTWARIFYTYGQGQSQQSLYSQLVKAAHDGQCVFDMSGGEQLRDFLPVSELATLIVDLSLQRVDAGIVNVCSGRPVSIRTLAENWIAANRQNIHLRFGVHAYPSYEPMAFWGVRHKLDRILNGGDV